ncbi:hypothetical protein GE21DRAFT_1274325 [Neurospora crassa]|nr:hypothetical protein GE21DRAFT_1274325 [Neurospora crassa]
MVNMDLPPQIRSRVLSALCQVGDLYMYNLQHLVPTLRAVMVGTALYWRNDMRRPQFSSALLLNNFFTPLVYKQQWITLLTKGLDSGENLNGVLIIYVMGEKVKMNDGFEVLL